MLNEDYKEMLQILLEEQVDFIKSGNINKLTDERMGFAALRPVKPGRSPYRSSPIRTLNRPSLQELPL
jgi:hypothetical protein